MTEKQMIDRLFNETVMMGRALQLSGFVILCLTLLFATFFGSGIIINGVVVFLGVIWGFGLIGVPLLLVDKRIDMYNQGGAGGVGGNGQQLAYGDYGSGRYVKYDDLAYEWPEEILPGEQVETQKPVTVH